MNISPLTLGIFILIAVLVTFVIIPLLGTTLLWFTSRMWQFEDKTFKSSFKVIVVTLGAMLVIVMVTQFLFIKGSFGQFAQSSPQSFSWFLFTTFLIGIIIGVIAIKKFFQESLVKSIGAAITFFVFSGILFFIIITIITIVSKTSVQNNNAVTTHGFTTQQTITTAKTTIKSDNAFVVGVVKYPKDAASWSLRLNCPVGITADMQAGTPDGKIPVGDVAHCNEDIALNKAPYTSYPLLILFAVKVTNPTKTDQAVSIVSESFDSSGVPLNESTLPITIQP